MHVGITIPLYVAYFNHIKEQLDIKYVAYFNNIEEQLDIK